MASYAWNGIVKEPIMRDSSSTSPALIADFKINGVWEAGGTAFFDNRIVNADAPSYSSQTWNTIAKRHAQEKHLKYNTAAEDLRASFGAKCSKCCRGIASSDWVRKARDHVYHLACFACEACKRQLSTGEEFALHEDRVLCKSHYLELVDGGTTSSDDGADSESSHSKSKAKRVRTTFTEEQLQVLQANFQLDSNPDGQDLERIAQITGLSKRVTQVWFQNSRARQKKHLHTGKMKSSQNIHSTSPGQSNDSGYGRHINLHLTYSFQQQHKTSPVYIPHHQAMSETSSIDDLSEDSMMLCSMRGEGSV
ncbi:LIM/homeobox protein Awh-like [Diaphorina citri]|uniref:LIM/homeobox protein Awh-like n=1 Tax=Diaphorina citri TaxID=121845 RepID=A0A1S4EI65_DIACI|nr:LIM/homeobox protein Awh-like [Diaphorina citri]